MPIKKSAKKALRSSAHKKVFNLKRNTAMKRAVKDVRKLVLAQDANQAEAKLHLAFQAIDKAAKRGVIKSATANRKKSRLHQAIKKIAVK